MSIQLVLVFVHRMQWSKAAKPAKPPRFRSNWWSRISNFIFILIFFLKFLYFLRCCALNFVPFPCSCYCCDHGLYWTVMELGIVDFVFSLIHWSFVVVMFFLLLLIFVTFVRLQRCHHTFLYTVASYSIFSNIRPYKQNRSHIHSHTTHDTLHRPFRIMNTVLSDRSGVSGFFSSFTPSSSHSIFSSGLLGLL